jgi:hypothetical protein
MLLDIRYRHRPTQAERPDPVKRGRLAQPS